MASLIVVIWIIIIGSSVTISVRENQKNCSVIEANIVKSDEEIMTIKHIKNKYPFINSKLSFTKIENTTLTINNIKTALEKNLGGVFYKIKFNDLKIMNLHVQDNTRAIVENQNVYYVLQGVDKFSVSDLYLENILVYTKGEVVKIYFNNKLYYKNVFILYQVKEKDFHAFNVANLNNLIYKNTIWNDQLKGNTCIK